MRLFWHFLTSNFRYNKLELAISYGLTIIFHLIYSNVQNINIGFYKKTGESAEIFISVAFYATLYVYYTNKRKTHIKYYLSLPISKAKLLLNKAISEFVFFIPTIYLINMGAYYYKTEIHHLALTFILMQVGVLVSLFLFDSAVEEPRLENAKASFINRIVYVRKTMDFIFRFVAVLYISFAIYLLQTSLILKEYMIIIMLGTVIFFKFQNSLQLIKDESLSYFVPKRDLVRASWKFGIVLAPLLAFKPASNFLSAYGNHKVVEYIVNHDMEKLKKHPDQEKDFKLILNNEYTPALVAIRHGNVDALKYMISKGVKIDFDREVEGLGEYGLKAMHLAYKSKNPEMIKYLGKYYPEMLGSVTTSEKKSILHFAIENCDGKMIDSILETKININLVNDDGETPLVSSAKTKCYYGVMALVNAGADVTISDLKSHNAFYYLKNNSFRYIVEKKYPTEFQRQIASEQIQTTSEGPVKSHE